MGGRGWTRTIDPLVETSRSLLSYPPGTSLPYKLVNRHYCRCVPIANVNTGFIASNTFPTHQKCLITYRSVWDLGKHPIVPIYSCLT